MLAITGASGVIYGLRALQYLLDIGQPVDLLVSEAALRVMREENDLLVSYGDNDLNERLTGFLELSGNVPLTLHDPADYGACVASGSYRTRGMAVIPCSLSTLAAIANGMAENLIHRAAAVCLKENRPFLVLVREMPFGRIPLKNMLAIQEAGGIVASASPGFYHRPQTISDQIDFVVGRTLDQFGFDHCLFKRWKGKARSLPNPSRILTAPEG